MFYKVTMPNSCRQNKDLQQNKLKSIFDKLASRWVPSHESLYTNERSQMNEQMLQFVVQNKIQVKGTK